MVESSFVQIKRRPGETARFWMDVVGIVAQAEASLSASTDQLGLEALSISSWVWE